MDFQLQWSNAMKKARKPKRKWNQDHKETRSNNYERKPVEETGYLEILDTRQRCGGGYRVVKTSIRSE